MSDTRQYVDDEAERALQKLKEWYSEDQLDLETFERLAGDLVAGRPTDLPFYVPRLLPATMERR